MSESDEKPCEVTQIMRLYLEELSLTGSRRKAAQKLDINERTPRRWYQTCKGYRELFDKLMTIDDLDLKKEVASLAGTAIDVMDEILTTAKKTIIVHVQCPECGTRIEKEYQITNDALRQKSAVDVLKMQGMMKEEKNIKIDSTHHIKFELITGSDKAVFFALQAGIRPSPHMLRRLQDLGLATADGQPTVGALPAGHSDAIEGEYREVT